MTPDGIIRRDWSLVESLAIKLAQAICSEQKALERKYIQKLLLLLDKLESKYGTLPSILATRAEFAPKTTQRLSLLKRAYEEAKKLEDKTNMTLIASSVAETYLTELDDIEAGQKWLKKLRMCLKEYFDPDEFGMYKRLRRRVTRLTKKASSRAHASNDPFKH
jgi:hypothetical protein